MLKKRILVLLTAISVLFASMQVQPRNAHAVIGYVTGGIAWTIPGAIIGVLGLMGVHGAALFELSPTTERYVAPTFWAGVGAILVGFVLLDEQGQPSLSFSSLTPPQAGQVGLTPAELEAYNGSIDEINAVVQSVSAEAIRAGDTSREFVHSRLLAYGQELAPEAMTAVQKISAHAIGAAQGRTD